MLLSSTFVLGYQIVESTRSPMITSTPEPTPTSTERVPTISTIPSTFTPPSQSHLWDPIVSEASYLLTELSEHLHLDLKKRQGAVGATNTAAVATTIPTQMPSVTVYQIHGAGPIISYTQTFPPNPDPWPSPSAGTIGLGTIQGTIGVVKTNSKRAALAQPTELEGRALRIRGRVVQ